jgi:hypothetical protein
MTPRFSPGRASRFPACALAALLAGLLLPFASLRAAAPEERDPMLARVFPSIVRIEAIRLRPTDGRVTKEWSGGSGVVISAEGHVLTNCHVTEDGDFFRGYLHDGSQLEAVLVGQDPLTDLAVIRLNLAQQAVGAPPLPVARFGDSAALRVGEEVFALGSPGFLAQSVTQGVVSNPSLVLPEQTVGKMMLRGEDVGQFVRWVLHDARTTGEESLHVTLGVLFSSYTDLLVEALAMVGLRDVAFRYEARIAIVPLDAPGLAELPFERLHATDRYAVIRITPAAQGDEDP